MALGALVAGGGCHPLPPPAPSPGPTACSYVCAAQAKLQCPGWQGSPGEDQEYGTEDDVPCVQACEMYNGAGVDTLPTECLRSAGDCDAFDACMATAPE